MESMETDNKHLITPSNYDLVCASVPQTSYVTNHNVTTSNVYELVNNLYVDVPTGKRVFIAVGAKKSNPIGIALCDNNTYAENRVIIQNEVSNAQGMVSATGIYDNGDSSVTTRLYVFMKSQTTMAIQSRITLSWWYI